MKYNHLNVPTHWKNYWTRYPEGHTILEALISWVSQVDSMVDNQNKLNTNVEQFRTEIDAFVERFDERLQKEVTHILSDWQTSGFLDVVISEALQWQLDDYITTNEQDKLSLTTQVQQNTTILAGKSTYITPTGTSDDTQHVQNAFDTYESIVLKKGVYHIDATTPLLPPANRTIEFQEGAILKCITNAEDSYMVLHIQNDNITVMNPQIIGDRDTHTGVTGEQGHGLVIGTCNNIKIVNPVIKKCWGDGIYILNRAGRIIIDNPFCEYNRRQGISVISADDLTINNPYCANTSGIAPAAGIDLEPTFADDIFNRVRINNPVTFNNEGSGITVSLAMLVGTNKTVNITITNHQDNLSTLGFSAFANKMGTNGKISLIKPFYKDNKHSGMYIRSCEAIDTPLIEIDNPTILNPNSTNSGASMAQNGIIIHRPVGDSGNNPIGNVIVKNPRIIDNRTPSRTTRGIWIRDEKEVKTQKISIIDPLEITGVLNPLSNMVFGNSGVTFRDHYKVFTFSSSANTTITVPYTVITNEEALTKTIFTLNKVNIQDAFITFRNVTNTGLQVKPEAGARIFPLASAGGKYIETTQRGASITLRKANATDYYIENITGDWTAEG